MTKQAAQGELRFHSIDHDHDHDHDLDLRLTLLVSWIGDILRVGYVRLQLSGGERPRGLRTRNTMDVQWRRHQQGPDDIPRAHSSRELRSLAGPRDAVRFFFTPFFVTRPSILPYLVLTTPVRVVQ